MVATKVSASHTLHLADPDAEVRKNLQTFAAKPPQNLKPNFFLLAGQDGHTKRMDVIGEPTFSVSTGSPPVLTVAIKARAKEPFTADEKREIAMKYSRDLGAALKAKYNIGPGHGRLVLDVT